MRRSPPPANSCATASRLGLCGWLLLCLILVACGSPSAPPAAPGPAPTATAVPNVVRQGELEPGQTLSEALDALGLPQGTTPKLLAALGKELELNRLRPGAEWVVVQAPGGTLVHMELNLSREHRYLVEPGPEGFKATKQVVAVEKHLHRVEGTIRTTVLEAVMEKGEDIHFAMGLVDAFQWDINFFTDVQEGDRFEALVEKVYVDGQAERLGSVLMARYVGKTVGKKEAFLFGDDYFDASGRYLQRTFLSAPLNVLKLTSRFGTRFHPILRKVRMHKGVDYGARTGTPVWAIAEGVVSAAGPSGSGYGNQVMIRHVGGIVSRYAHLSRVSVRNGQKVRQKQLIGAVGATGLALGAHLHFEMLQNGQQVNPARFRLLPTVTRYVKDKSAFAAERSRIEGLFNDPRLANGNALPLAQAVQEVGAGSGSGLGGAGSGGTGLRSDIGGGSGLPSTGSGTPGTGNMVSGVGSGRVTVPVQATPPLASPQR